MQIITTLPMNYDPYPIFGPLGIFTKFSLMLLYNHWLPNLIPNIAISIVSINLGFQILEGNMSDLGFVDGVT